MTILQNRIKQQRKKVNKTLAALAEELGVKEATVQRYESGVIKNLKYNTIVALANALQCSPTYLLGWTDDPEPFDHGVKETVTHVIFTDHGNMEAVRFPDALMTDDGELLDLTPLTKEEKDDIINYIKYILYKNKK